jgi:hypothetical protein
MRECFRSDVGVLVQAPTSLTPGLNSRSGVKTVLKRKYRRITELGAPYICAGMGIVFFSARLKARPHVRAFL